MTEKPKLSKHIQAAVNNIEKQIAKLRKQRDKEKVKIEQGTRAFEELDIAISDLFNNIQTLKGRPESSAETLIEVSKGLK